MAHLQQLAALHQADPVGQLEGLLLVVGDQDGGDAELPLDLPQVAPELGADLDVERAERLVEQQHRGLVGEGAGEGDPLLLAAGELVGVAVAEAAEAHAVEQLLAPPRPLGRRHLADLQAGTRCSRATLMWRKME